MRRALVVLGGCAPGAAFLRKMAAESDFLLCADSGLDAAIAAGVGTGVFESYEAASSKAVAVRETVYPRPEMKEIYEEKYARYRATIDALANVWDVFQ